MMAWYKAGHLGMNWDAVKPRPTGRAGHDVEVSVLQLDLENVISGKGFDIKVCIDTSDFMATGVILIDISKLVLNLTDAKH